MSESWLEEIFRTSEAQGLCVNPHGTTCGGADEFFSRYVYAAATEANVPHPPEFRPLQALRFVQDLSDRDKAAVYRSLVGALRDLDRRWFGSTPLEHIQIRFWGLLPLLLWNASGTLESALKGSPIGQWLAEERSLRERPAPPRDVSPPGEIRTRRLQAIHSIAKRGGPGSTAEMPGPKGPAAWGDPGLDAFVRELRQLSASDRLRRIITQTSYRVSELPHDVVPLRGVPLDLSPATTEALLRAIPETEVVWSELRQRLVDRMESQSDRLGEEAGGP